ncbi:hypothetical protein ACFLS9_07720 [Bacteroidota bacterium]
MKSFKKLNTFLTVLCIISAIIISCQGEKPPTETAGSISGKIIWDINVPPPCPELEWPPDTCLMINLYNTEEKTVSEKLPFPCKFEGEWPPDTCDFEFQKVLFGKYKILLIAADSLYLVDEGIEGCKTVVGYYPDPGNQNIEGVVELNKKTNKITDINVLVKQEQNIQQ